MSAPPAPATHRRGRRSGFPLLVWGIALNAVALVGWTLGGMAEPGSTPQTVSFIASVFVQVAAVSCIGAATVVGIIGLTRKARPIVWPVLSVLSIPIALAVWFPMVVVVWILVG